MINRAEKTWRPSVPRGRAPRLTAAPVSWETTGSDMCFGSEADMCSAHADVRFGPIAHIDETTRQYMPVEPNRTEFVSVAAFLFWRLLHLGEYFIQVEAGRFLPL